MTEMKFHSFSTKICSTFSHSHSHTRMSLTLASIHHHDVWRRALRVFLNAVKHGRQFRASFDLWYKLVHLWTLIWNVYMNNSSLDSYLKGIHVQFIFGLLSERYTCTVHLWTLIWKVYMYSSSTDSYLKCIISLFEFPLLILYRSISGNLNVF